jgi:excisionase family DNA binding protein
MSEDNIPTKQLSDAVACLAATITQLIDDQVKAIHERENKQHVLEEVISLNKKEVGKMLGIAPRTIDRWMKRGLLPYYKIGRIVRFKLREVQKHLESNNRINRG